MAGETVLNRFEQTPGPLGSADNKLVLGGSVESPSGASLAVVRYDFSTADFDTDTDFFIAPGFAGTITRIVSSYDGVGTSGSVAINALINGVAVTGSVAMTSGNRFLIFQAVPSALNVFTAAQSIKIETIGTSPVAFDAGGITVELTAT